MINIDLKLVFNHTFLELNSFERGAGIYSRELLGERAVHDECHTYDLGSSGE